MTVASQTPWLEWRGMAALLGWPPNIFWDATPHDLIAAIKGKALLHSGLSTGDLADLRTLLNRSSHEL